MCGRYTLANPDPKRLKLRFGLADGSFEFDERPRFNIAPTDSVLAVRRAGLSGEDAGPGDSGAPNEPGSLRWGLLPGRWADEPGRPLINAKSETVATQPAFKESFLQRRCLIPADGFYEWRKDENGKQPIWINRADDELFAFAGIWASLEREGGERIHSCSILTCEPNDLMRPIHDRMPVILGRDDEAGWLDPDADPAFLEQLLQPAPSDELATREVNDAVSNVREDGPQLLDPPMKLF